MDLTPDPLVVELRAALRTALAGVPVNNAVHGAPVTDGSASPARAVLDRLGVPDFERPASAGGLDLRLTAGIVVSEELGRAACGNPYRADALAADAGQPVGVALAGFEAVPVGSGVQMSAGGELTGTATVDDPEPKVLLMPARDGALVSVAADAPGRDMERDCWPPVVRFDGTPATVTGDLDAPLARGRLRQAAYLLGIADGALETAVRHTGVRRQFDSRLRDLPVVSFPLARALVAVRAARAAVYRGAWLIDAGREPGTAPVAALAMAAETARAVVRVAMQSCGVRAMTSELGLHRYFRLAQAEGVRYGAPAALWRLVGAARLLAANGSARD
ncbi:acyl-CoA dehydrogenase family protein [Solwaraspora sp. WMMB335]|uniref:acyl-CoA dehydrogenase family protein n=1 Tax=Solwaraspora sp. WMMB335 TaxID=3404118 RepID=UPI003B957C2D